MFVVFGATGLIGRAIQVALAARGACYIGFGRLTCIRCDNTGRRIISEAKNPTERASVLQSCPATEAVIFAAGPALATTGPDVLRAAHLTSLNEAFEVLSQRWRRGLPFVYTSSGLVYGRRPSPRPIKETDPAVPNSVYGEIKLRCEERLAKWAVRVGAQHLAARLFNVAGPGQVNGIVMDIARQVAEIRSGTRVEFQLRSNTPILDVTDVREAAEGLIRLAEGPAGPAVVNLCSGRPLTTDDMIVAARKMIGCDVPVTYEDDRGPCEALIGDPVLMTATTGWRAQKHFDQILADVILSFQTSKENQHG